MSYRSPVTTTGNVMWFKWCEKMSQKKLLMPRTLAFSSIRNNECFLSMGIVTWKAPQIYASKNIEKYEVINVSMDINGYQGYMIYPWRWKKQWLNGDYIGKSSKSSISFESPAGPAPACFPSRHRGNKPQNTTVLLWKIGKWWQMNTEFNAEPWKKNMSKNSSLEDVWADIDWPAMPLRNGPRCCLHTHTCLAAATSAQMSLGPQQFPVSLQFNSKSSISSVQ